MTEADLYRKIIALFPAPSHALRVENMIGSGIPDLNICHMGCEAWVECKLTLNRETILRKEQYAWGMRRGTAGGNVWVFSLDGLRMHCWSFPNIQVKPWHKDAKYVSITNNSMVSIDDLIHVKKILFPGF